MKKSIFAILFALSLCAPSFAATLPISAGASTASIQSTINAAVVGDTVSFTAGSYSITSGLTLKCGVTYTGPVLGTGNIQTPTAILNATFGGNIFSLFPGGGFVNPCTTPTTIQYLAFMNANGIYVRTSFTKLTIQYNKFGNIPYTSAHDTAGLYLDGTTTISAQVLTSSTIQWNQFGDSTSCNGEFTIVNDGLCQGVADYSSVNGLTVKNNNFFHLAEGFHLNCPGNSQQYACEPPGGASSYNLIVQNNDFSNIHRINWEEQFQQSGGVVFQYNSSHDWLNPDPGSFGLSMACCANGTSNPNIVVDSNLSVFNTPPWSGRYGYGIEAMGHSSTYTHNMVQSGVFSSYAQGIAWGNGGGAASNTFNFTNNYVCGSWQGYPSNLSQYISNENVAGSNYTPPTTGSNYQTTCAATTSVAPTISPASGGNTYPLAVTLTDTGYTSGAVAQGNTGIWYTIDGSTPVPGTGTALRVDSGTSFVLATAATVKAVGMWGAANQPTAYPTGYGFVPSSVVSSTFTGGGTSTLTGMTLSGTQALLAPGGVASQLSANGTYSNGTSGSVTPTAWVSSSPSIATVSSSGLVTPVTTGTTNITSTLSSVTSSPALTITVNAPVITGGHLSTTPTNGINSMAVGGTQQFQPIATYANGATGPVAAVGCTWSSANSAVLTVSPAGLVTAVGGGTANVQVSCSGVIFSPWGVNVAAATLSSTSLSTTPTAGITTVTVGATVQLATTGTFSDGSSTVVSPTSYTSSTLSICTVTNTGLVTGVSAGACSITSLTGSTTSSAYTPTITASTLVSMSLSGPSSIINVGTTQLLGATGIYSDASSHSINPASWVSLQLPICTVDASGNVTAVAVGSCTITAVQGSVTSSGFNITVQPAPPPSQFSVLNVGPVISVSIIGEPIQLSAVGVSPTGAFGTPLGVAWVSSNTSVATVDANGLVTLVGIGTAQITVTLGSLTSSAASIVSLPTFANATYQYSPCCSLLYGLSVGTHTLTVNANGSVTIN